MTDPFNTTKEQVKYWQNKFDSEFERAKSYEMDIVYLNYRIRELEREVARLIAEKKQLEVDVDTLLIEGAANAK